MNVARVNESARKQVMSTVIQLRVSKVLKEQFTNECSRNGVEVASVLRALMEEYIEESKSINKGVQ